MAKNLDINGSDSAKIKANSSVVGIQAGEITVTSVKVWANSTSYVGLKVTSLMANGGAIVDATSIERVRPDQLSNSIVFEGNMGKMDGNVTLRSNFTITAGKTLAIESAFGSGYPVRLTISHGCTLENYGTINVNPGGTLENSGKIINIDNGVVNNNGGAIPALSLVTVTVADKDHPETSINSITPEKTVLITATITQGKAKANPRSAAERNMVYFNLGDANNTQRIYAQWVNFTTAKSPIEGTATIDNKAPKFDETLTATHGITTQDPGAISYQWVRGSADIAGATNETYKVVAEDVGKTIAVKVTAANCAGTLTSAATTAVGKQSGPAAPTNGTVDDTANTFTFDSVSGTVYEYTTHGTWSGSTSSVTAAGNRTAISVGDVYIAAGLFKVRVKATDTVEAGADLASTEKFTKTLSGTVTITGKLEYGEILTANYTGPADAQLRYTWIARGQSWVTGPDNTYRMDDSYIGFQWIVEVTSDSVEYSGKVTSAQTRAVDKRSISFQTPITGADACTKIYDGTTQFQDITLVPAAGVVIEGNDITVKANGTTENADVGTDKRLTITQGTAKISGTDSRWYRVGKIVEGKAKITQRALSNAVIADIANQTYTGQPLNQH